MLKEKFLTIDHAPHITIVSCAGDLIIRGHSETAVICKGEDFTVDEADNSFSISSNATLKMYVPEAAHLAIKSVASDASIKFLTGDISISEVNRDLILSGVQTAKINTVHHDLSAKNIENSIHAEIVHGDVSVRNVTDLNLATVHGDISARYVNNSVHINEAMGDVGLRSIKGDVYVAKGHRDVALRNIGGQLKVENTAGDIRLYGNLSQQAHALTAERDIILRWPPTSDLQLTAQAPKIKNRLPLEKVVETEDGLVGSIGDGETQLTLKANGRIILNEDRTVDARWEMPEHDEFNFDFSFDLEGFGNQIRDKFNSEISRFSTEIEAKLGPDFGKRVSEQISKKMEMAAEKAERAAARATEQAERAANRARKQAEYQMRRSPGRPPGRSKADASSAPSTTEEKLKILKMVEQGIITPDEAATLLEALGK